MFSIEMAILHTNGEYGVRKNEARLKLNFIIYLFCMFCFGLVCAINVFVSVCCGDFELKIHFELKLNDVSNQCVSI